MKTTKPNFNVKLSHEEGGNPEDYCHLMMAYYSNNRTFLKWATNITLCGFKESMDSPLGNKGKPLCPECKMKGGQ